MVIDHKLIDIPNKVLRLDPPAIERTKPKVTNVYKNLQKRKFKPVLRHIDKISILSTKSTHNLPKISNSNFS